MPVFFYIVLSTQKYSALKTHYIQCAIALFISVSSFAQDYKALDWKDITTTQKNDSIDMYYSNGKLLDGTYKIGNKDNVYYWDNNFSVITFSNGIKHGYETIYYENKLDKRIKFVKGIEEFRYSLGYNYGDDKNTKTDSTYTSKTIIDRFSYDFDGHLALRMYDDKIKQRHIRTTYYKTGEIAIEDFSSLLSYNTDSIYHYHKNKQVLKTAYFNNGKKSGVEDWYTQDGKNWLKLVFSNDELKHGQIMRNGNERFFQINTDHDWPISLTMEKGATIKNGLYLNPLGYISPFDDFDVVKTGFAVDTPRLSLNFENYADNLLNGEQLILNEKGNVMASFHYKNNQLHGDYNLYRNGKNYFTANFKNGVLAQEGCFISEGNTSDCEHKYLEHNVIGFSNERYQFRNNKLNGNYIVQVDLKTMFDDAEIYNLYKNAHPEFELLAEVQIPMNDWYKIKYHSEATYLDGQKHGKELIYQMHPMFTLDSYNTISERYYDHGKKIDTAVMIMDDIKIEIPYTNNKKEGMVRFFKIESEYDYDKKDYITKIFKVTNEFPYKNNALNGIVKHYDIYGDLSRTETYKDNYLDGLTTNYDGNIVEKIHYKNHKKHGAYQLLKDGKVVKQCHYNNGLMDGKYQEFDDNELIYEITYKAGIIIDQTQN